MHLSQKQLEAERNGRKFGITHIIIVIFQIFKKFLNKFPKNLKKHKSALISETVRDRAKKVKIWDHTHCKRSLLQTYNIYIGCRFLSPLANYF